MSSRSSLPRLIGSVIGIGVGIIGLFWLWPGLLVLVSGATVLTLVGAAVYFVVVAHTDAHPRPNLSHPDDNSGPGASQP